MKLAMYRGVPFLLPEAGDTAASKDALRATPTFIEQMWHLHQFVAPQTLSLLELFSGVGIGSAPLRSRKLTKHVGIGTNPNHLEAFSSLHDHAEPYECDPYCLAPTLLKECKYDYVIAAYNGLTMYRALQDNKERKLIEALFTSGARYVAITDSAKTHEHIHYQRYSKFFDSPVFDSTTYVEAAGNCICRLFKYGVIAASYDAYSYTMLFEKGARCDTSNVCDVRTKVDLKQYKELTAHVDV